MSRLELLASLRGLWRSRRLAVAAVLCLALGTAAVSGMITLVRGALLRPLPFPEAERLVRVWRAEGVDRQRIELSYPLTRALRQGMAGFDAFEATARLRMLAFGGDQGGRRVEGEAVTPGYFDLLGLEPLVGRLFSPAEYDPAHRGVIVISHAAWGPFFGYDPGVVGRTLRTQDGVFEVVGVLPAGFTGTVEDDAGEIELWLPIDHYVSAERRARWDVGGLWGIGRLRPGTGRAAAAGELAALAERLAREHPEAQGGRQLVLEPLAENWRSTLRRGSFLLLAAAAGLLLVAALNVAALLLAHALGRRRERAVQRALGASAASLVRRALLEAAALALVGGALGFALGQLLLPAVLERATVVLPDYVTLRPDPVALLAVAAVLALAALLAAAAPALAEARTDPGSVLKDQARGGTASRRARRGWAALVLAEVALTTVLVFASMVMLRSYATLLADDLGFRTEGMLRVALFLGPEEVPEGDGALPFLQRLRDQVAAHPGVEGVAMMWPTIPIWSPVEEAVRWSGMPADLEERGLRVGLFATEGALFDVLEIPTLSGRVFRAGEEQGAVAVVSRSLAERLGGVERALGRELQVSDGPARVVGVVADTRLGGAQEDEAHRYELYLPLGRSPLRYVTFMVATGRDPGAMAEELGRRVGALAPASALDWVGSVEYWLGERYRESRFAPLLLGMFAAGALGITGIGVFALLAAAVEGRRSEIGVRKALGASPARVRRDVVARGAVLAGAGVAAGAAMAWPLARALDAFVYGMSSRDPLSLALAAAALVAVAALGAWAPAARAARLDPMAALRDE
ncbi:MAG TPA: ABC transporter permease [Thermoanaerobaculia bacterium]|nr:ABC transporter permease [Thermoanaerobaculia bacterium]